MSGETDRPFFPSNSDHGYAFEAAFCHQCRGYFGGYCRVLGHAIANGKSPKWIKADNNLGGECTSFKPKGERSLKPKVNKRQGVLL